MPNALKLSLPFFVILAFFVLQKPPGPEKILKQTQFSEDATRITYQELDYELAWEEEPAVFSGDVQQIKFEHTEYAPFVTHHLVLTTEDYSDPDKVTIQPLKKGKTSWRAKTQPKGKFLVLHLIPPDADTLSRIQAVAAGQEVTWTGKRLKGGMIKNANGGYYRVNNTNHILLLLSDLQLGPAPLESEPE